MADRKPPRLHGDERATLQALLQYQRESFVRKIEGVPDIAARTSPVASGTTLLWLAKHMARAELLWIAHRFAGESPSEVGTDVVGDGDSVAATIAAYRATWSRVDAIVAAVDLDDLCRLPGEEGAADLRWVLAHLLEETARHAGHADILRELIDSSTGR
jgi:Protein of unknown function (DUF664)